MLRMLFVPGIKGTELLSNEDNVWFPKNMRDLRSLDFTNPLEPGNLLRTVSAFSFMHVDIYKGILDTFKIPMFDYYLYDWRQDITTHVDGLVNRIKALSSAGDEVVLVAHSMGGMLAKLAILELEKKGELKRLKKLITLGTPWHGSPDAYKALAYGEPGIFPKLYQVLMFFDDKLTRRMARQFPSVFQLLPSEYYFDSEYGKFLYDPYKEKDYQDIIQRASSFFRDDNEQNIEVWTEYMKPLHDAMLSPLPKDFQHDCLIGHCHPTLYQVPDNSLFGMRVFFKSDVIFMNGDGVVPIFSAKPAHAANIYYVDGQHHELCSNQTVLNFIKWSINGKTGTIPAGIDVNSQEDLHNGFMAKIKCPVNPTFLDKDDKYVAGQFDPSVEEVSELSQDPRLMYFSIGDSKYLFLPEDVENDIKIKVTSYEKGIADISLQIFEDEITEINFEPLPVEKGETALVSLTLSKNPVDSSLKKTKGREYESSIKKKKSFKEDIIKKRPSVPSLEVFAKTVEGTKKVPYHNVFSGPIKLVINSSDNQLVEVIYYSLDGNPPMIYKEVVPLSLSAGEHKVEVFGKDIYGRPLLAKVYEFSVDTIAPITKANLNVTPEGLEVSFTFKSLGTKVSTYYRFMDEQVNETSEWESYEVSKNVVRAWGKLAQSKNQVLKLQYYSENPFGPKEEVKTLIISLGDIPALMWDDNTSYVTPEMIWVNVLKDNPFAMADFNVTLIGKSLISGTYSENIADNIKGVTFESSYLRLDVMYDEKYALFFIGPPTEVLTVGEEYRFSFELLTERSKDKIKHTSPRASLRALRAAFPDKQITLEEVNGTFKGKFIVDEKFDRHKFKLVITDQKNTSPALREIPLTLKENNLDY